MRWDIAWWGVRIIAETCDEIIELGVLAKKLPVISGVFDKRVFEHNLDGTASLTFYCNSC